ncbi:hypothetical protein SNE40_019645 [Patella caerulea]|uniref:Uncharacterized protein n=1 Tax=Patella caerulea TaxID=87958 RepID=A0AAN8J9H1_PATCE
METNKIQISLVLDKYLLFLHSAPVVNMCNNEVKTGSRLSLDINIKPNDNINNCSCILQLIQPDIEQTYTVTFTPFYPNNYWCYYSLTMTHDSTRGICDCTHQPQSTQFQLKPRETVDILLKKESNEDDRKVTRCMDIQSDAGTSFNISCSLLNNQSPTTVLINFISSFTTTDYHTPTITSSITSTSTIIGGEPQANSNTQRTQVGAIIGGVLGGIVVIGGVVLTILVWRCYRTKISEEDTTYSSLDLQHNINPEDLTYQGLQTNLSSTQPTSTAENCLTNQAFSTDEQFTSNQSASIRQINNSLILNQPTSTDATDHNLSVTPTYENQSSPIGLTNTDQDR